MCGINGIFSKNPINNIEQRVLKMNESIIHRGPDSGDKYILDNNRGGLGHRRLSIIDLDPRSNQPMKSNDGNFVIVFNGEIVNFMELRKLLNYDFKTNSDTEVILAALEEKNIEWLLDKAIGMFALCVYDLQSDTITLVRDRHGIKPLFYTIVDDTLIFSSEIKGILASGLYEASMREESIDEYLGYRYIRQPFTFFENLFQINSGEIVTFDSNIKTKTKSYYTLPSLNFEKKFNEVEIIEELDQQIFKAVKRWSIADVKVGSYLSGGVDSSLITAILAKTSTKTIDTYTIGFKDDNYNEFEYARIVADLYSTNHREIVIDSIDYMAEWDRLISFKDAPLGVPNEIPLSIMSTILSKDITVVMSGEGADELFGGYGKIFRLPFDYNNDNNNVSFYEKFIDEYEYVPRNIRDKYLSVPNSRKYFDDKIKKQFNKTSNEESIFTFFQKYHIQGLLHRVDMTTMQTSVEARPPFLDHELVDFAYRQVPYNLKLKWKSESFNELAKKEKAIDYSENYDIPKYALKQVAKKYLPDEIINRKKVGFPVPLTNWFPSLIELSNELLKNSNWLHSDKLSSLQLELKTNPRAGQLLWMFINIEKFKRKYFNKLWKW
jgi:asparagine synthase (glutamine-hydrolysing)